MSGGKPTSPQKRFDANYGAPRAGGSSSSPSYYYAGGAAAGGNIADVMFPRYGGMAVGMPPVVYIAVAPQPRIVMREQIVMTPFGLVRQLVPVMLSG